MSVPTLTPTELAVVHGAMARATAQGMSDVSVRVDVLAEILAERTNARYVADFMAGRTLIWRQEAFRLAAKTGEALEVSAGVEDERLLADARAALASATEGAA